jgi:hypothetical protein
MRSDGSKTTVEGWFLDSVGSLTTLPTPLSTLKGRTSTLKGPTSILEMRRKAGTML